MSGVSNMSGAAKRFRSMPEIVLPQQFEIPDRLKHVAPARGKDETREIQCAQFLQVDKLSQTQRADLATGTAAVEAVWKAVQADPFWTSKREWPMSRCILVALTVRDVLHGTGRTDAKVAPIGMIMRQTLDATKLNAIGIGCPGTPVSPSLWPAHMIVQLGDIILDPTCGQTQRFWNAAPDAAALLLERKSGRKVELNGWGNANVKAEHFYTHADFDYRVTYFELTRSISRNSGYWVKTRDAQPEQRKKLVCSAERLLQADTVGQSLSS